MKQITLFIDSQLENVNLVDECITAVCQLTPLSSFDVDSKVRLAVREAINNVIKHSYKGEPNHPICLTLQLQEDFLSITLYDKGCGINPAKIDSKGHLIVDPESPVSARYKLGGRGLLIINESMDNVSYHSKAGKHSLQMIKNFN